MGIEPVVPNFAANRVSVSALVYLLLKLLVTVVEKLASLPKASASSFNVSRVPGAPLTRLPTTVFTKAVEATVFSFLVESTGSIEIRSCEGRTG